MYSYGNAYDPEFCHGNIIHEPMQTIVQSVGHRRAIETAAQRVADAWTSCQFFGNCSGYPIAEEAPLQQRLGAPLSCYVDRPMLEDTENRLQELGAIDRAVICWRPPSFAPTTFGVNDFLSSRTSECVWRIRTARPCALALL